MSLIRSRPMTKDYDINYTKELWRKNYNFFQILGYFLLKSSTEGCSTVEQNQKIEDTKCQRS